MVYGAIDLGGTNIRVALLDSSYKILDSIHEPSVHGTKEDLGKQIVRMFRELVSRHTGLSIRYVGISAAGFFENGAIKLSINLNNIRDFDIVAILTKAFPNMLFRAANDANCSALIEALEGAGKNYDSALFMTISTGIGVGLVVGKKLVDLPFETGHMQVNYHDHYYDFESICSGNGIVNLCRLNSIDVASAKDFFALVSAKDKKIMPVYDDWLHLLGSVLANLQLNFNTEIDILSGGVMKSLDVFEKDLLKVTNDFLKPYPCRKIAFKEGLFKQDTGIYGGLAEAISLENDDKKRF